MQAGQQTPENHGTDAPATNAGNDAQTPDVGSGDAQTWPQSVEDALVSRYIQDADAHDPMWSSFTQDEKAYLASQAGIDVVVTETHTPDLATRPAVGPQTAALIDAARDGSQTNNPPGTFDAVGAPAQPAEVPQGEDLPIDGKSVLSFTDGMTTGRPVDENTAKNSHLYTGLPQPAAPEGRIIEPGEEVRFKGEEVNGRILVTENVYRKVISRGSREVSYVKLHDAGSYASGAAHQLI